MKILKYILYIVLCLSLAGCQAPQEQKEVKSVVTNESETKVLTGTVIESKDKIISVSDKNGDIYSINIADAQMSVSQDGIMIGCPAEIEYTENEGVLTAQSVVTVSYTHLVRL